MNTLFKRFPRVELNLNGKTIQYHDIYRFINTSESVLQGYIHYNPYEIQDGERPDHVAQKIYRNSDFYWTFFIVNPHLQNGIQEWPMSSQALDTYIQTKYRDTGVIALEPKSSGLPSSITNYFDQILGTNLGIPILNGLDLTYKNLRIKRTVSNDNDNYAKIHKYDAERGQLWVTDVKDKFFYSPDSNYDFEIILINPYEIGDPEYTETEIANEAYLERVKTDWYEPIFGTYTGDDFHFEFETVLSLTAREYYENSYLAPDHFEDQNGKWISRLDHSIINGGGFPVPNFVVERNKNESKRFIRVVKPNLIHSFVDKYNQAIKTTTRLRA